MLYLASSVTTTVEVPCSVVPPAAFRLPAFASRIILFPLRDWAFLTVGLPACQNATENGSVLTERWTSLGLPCSACMRCERGGCLLNPGSGGVIETLEPTFLTLCLGIRNTEVFLSFTALATVQTYEHAIGLLTITRRHRKVHLRSPVRSSLSPVAPRWPGLLLGLNSKLPTPPLPVTQVRVRDEP